MNEYRSAVETQRLKDSGRREEGTQTLGRQTDVKAVHAGSDIQQYYTSREKVHCFCGRKSVQTIIILVFLSYLYISLPLFSPNDSALQHPVSFLFCTIHFWYDVFFIPSIGQYEPLLRVPPDFNSRRAMYCSFPCVSPEKFQRASFSQHSAGDSMRRAVIEEGSQTIYPPNVCLVMLCFLLNGIFVVQATNDARQVAHFCCATGTAVSTGVCSGGAHVAASSDDAER